MLLKKSIILLFVISNMNFAFAQKQFPINITLKDTLNKKVNTNTIMYNSNKPIIIIIWASFIQSNIDLLDSFEQVYPEWQKKYGIKIIAISIEETYRRKKAIKLINQKKWPFNFYFDHGLKYF